MLLSIFFFFFSSRRRHTRFKCDWSSDVCSSDLSMATFVGGLTSNFLFFLIARSFVGLGEAAYAPAAQSMISGGFPQERRARAQAIFASGMLLGGAAGHVLGGIIVQRYGWQEAIFIVALAGLVPAMH